MSVDEPVFAPWEGWWSIHLVRPQALYYRAVPCAVGPEKLFADRHERGVVRREAPEIACRMVELNHLEHAMRREFARCWPASSVKAQPTTDELLDVVCDRPATRLRLRLARVAVSRVRARAASSVANRSVLAAFRSLLHRRYQASAVRAQVVPSWRERRDLAPLLLLTDVVRAVVSLTAAASAPPIGLLATGVRSDRSGHPSRGRGAVTP